MDKQKRLPDLPDMIAVGIGLSEALAFWNRMMNSPQREKTDWWAEMRRQAIPSSSASGMRLQ